ncbi:MAG TPA: Zn-dependent hydrolase, partial [Acidimicrobiia bacterium]|nr:Zn-dependent hydrolase [Acidimicrobiia bacterium]
MTPDVDRLLADLQALAAVGATGDGGNCRLALTDDDAGGRELVVGWMRDLGLDVRVDRIGNVVATR